MSGSLFVSWWDRGKISFQWERLSYIMSIAAICIKSIFFFHKISFDIVNETLVWFVPCCIVVRERERELSGNNSQVVVQLKLLEMRETLWVYGLKMVSLNGCHFFVRIHHLKYFLSIWSLEIWHEGELIILSLTVAICGSINWFLFLFFFFKLEIIHWT